MNFFYVYILQSEAVSGHFYTGITDNLQQRLQKHNSGGVPHTAKFRPWRIKTAIAFTDHERAVKFERYLKSPSGRAFAKEETLMCNNFLRPQRSEDESCRAVAHSAQAGCHDKLQAAFRSGKPNRMFMSLTIPPSA